MVTLVLPTSQRLARTAHLSTTIPRAVFAESRPAVQLIFLMRSTVASGIVFHPSFRSLTGIFAWALITISIYVFNGVTDLTTDSANHSARPIASGLLGRSTAITWCVALSAIGLGMCWYVSLAEFGLGVAMLTLGWAYSAGPSLKTSATGFAIVIGLGAALTYAAGWAAGGRVTVHDLVLALSISLWVGVCCAAKDFSDIDGDRVAGRRTWPVVLGPRRAAHLLSVLAVAASVIALWAAVQLDATPLPALALVVGSLTLARVASKSANAPDRIARRRPYRYFVVAQYATNGAMLIAGAI
ncbi:MAG: UbiA family prenyltransferase [Actinomycetota bacterium]|nr:UbiA family prenyltransferase [Actinomycetota bacterium]